MRWANSPLRPIIRETIKKAYPQISELTPIQARIMSAMEKRIHLTVADIPGTGKSFAIAMWLVSAERSTRTVEGKLEPTTTAVVLVPNPDLARQYHSWISNILMHSGSKMIQQSLPAFVQALYRTGNVKETQAQDKLLEEYPNPHIIIATPTRLLDLISYGASPVAPPSTTSHPSGNMEKKNGKKGKHAVPIVPTQKRPIDIDHLKYVVADEADSLFTLSGPARKIKRYTGPPTPAEFLLDYIFKRRNHKLTGVHHAKLPTNYIQLILLSSSISSKIMRRWVELERRIWLTPYPSEAGSQNKAMLSFTPQMPAVERGALVSTNVMSIQRERTIACAILSKIHENIKHYLVGYNMESGLLQDAPIKREEVQKAMVEMFQEDDRRWKLIQACDKAIKANVELSSEELNEVAAVEDEFEAERMAGDDGYPEGTLVTIVEKLLEQDQWPKNVLVGLATMASKVEFKRLCELRGINAEVLSFETWNAKATAPIGRTDLDLSTKLKAFNSPETSKNDQFEAEPLGDPLTTEDLAKRSRTTLWITDLVSCAGLDTPGILHAYILHRIANTKDYIAYCGRVSRNPFPDSPTSLYQLPPFDASNPLMGKVVTVLLTEGITPAEAARERVMESEWVMAVARGEKFKGRAGPGYKPGKGEKVLRFNRGGTERGALILMQGSLFEKDVWVREGVKREKIGCKIENYFAVDEENKEVRGIEQGEEDRLILPPGMRVMGGSLDSGATKRGGRTGRMNRERDEEGMNYGGFIEAFDTAAGCQRGRKTSAENSAATAPVPPTRPQRSESEPPLPSRPELMPEPIMEQETKSPPTEALTASAPAVPELQLEPERTPPSLEPNPEPQPEIYLPTGAPLPLSDKKSPSPLPELETAPSPPHPNTERIPETQLHPEFTINPEPTTPPSSVFLSN